MNPGEALSELRALANPANLKGMARYGIRVDDALGVSIPTLRAMAKRAGRDQALALALWESGIHEARILAGMVADPALADDALMESWARDFDSWDVCDQVCGNYFDRTALAPHKAREWALRDEEYVKRAGFVLMAALTVHDKAADDALFLGFFGLIRKGSSDDRNFVRKAVNWALRQIGKRNPRLHRKAVLLAEELASSESKPAIWIGKDAVRELTSDAVMQRMDRQSKKDL